MGIDLTKGYQIHSIQRMWIADTDRKEDLYNHGLIT
ncbi:hypothetical protein VDGL01_02266 [Verticillium dahliae]